MRQRVFFKINKFNSELNRKNPNDDQFIQSFHETIDDLLMTLIVCHERGLYDIATLIIRIEISS
jgi:hypothetical protein